LRPEDLQAKALPQGSDLPSEDLLPEDLCTGSPLCSGRNSEGSSGSGPCCSRGSGPSEDYLEHSGLGENSLQKRVWFAGQVGCSEGPCVLGPALLVSVIRARESQAGPAPCRSGSLFAHRGVPRREKIQAKWQNRDHNNALSSQPIFRSPPSLSVLTDQI